MTNDHFRIIGSGLELICNSILLGEPFKCKLHLSLSNDIPPHEPPLQASCRPLTENTNLVYLMCSFSLVATFHP